MTSVVKSTAAVPTPGGNALTSPLIPHSEEMPEEKRDAWWAERVERARITTAVAAAESIHSLREESLLFRIQLHAQLHDIKDAQASFIAI